MVTPKKHLPLAQASTPSSGRIHFCPNGHRAQTIVRTDFTDEKKKAIRSLHSLNKHWNIIILLPFGLWIGAGFLALQTDNIFVNLLCYVSAGLGLSTLSVIVHESTHNLFTHNPKIDRWIGFFCSLPLLLCSQAYRIRHPIHHKHVRSENDPDDIENLSSSARVLKALYWVMFFFGAYLFLFDVPLEGIKRTVGRRRIVILLECGFTLAVHLTAWMLIPASVIAEAWLLPMLVAVQIGNVRGLAEHGITLKENEFIDTRTVTTSAIASFLMCNVNYHLEHHLYPGVPWYNLPKLHRLFDDSYRKAGASVYRSYVSLLIDMLKVFTSARQTKGRLIPAHLRREICL